MKKVILFLLVFAPLSIFGQTLQSINPNTFSAANYDDSLKLQVHNQRGAGQYANARVLKQLPIISIVNRAVSLANQSAAMQYKTIGSFNQDTAVINANIRLANSNINYVRSISDTRDDSLKAAVNGKTQPDWNATTGFSSILNKPQITSQWSFLGNALAGNTGAFLGTTDNTDLVFKRNNIIAIKISDNSQVSFGNSIASGDNSVSFGESTNASGQSSFAMGSNSIASGQSSFAIGEYATSSAIGSVSMGTGTIASGQSSFAIGEYATSSAIGSVSMGTGTNAIGQSSISMGAGTNAIGQSSISMGENSISSGQSSISMGTGTIASGQSSISMGENSIASGQSSISMGAGTNASGIASFAAGQNTIAKAAGSATLGLFNDSSDNPNNSGTDRILQVGNGDDGGESNALTILRNGNASFGSNYAPTEKLEVSGRVKMEKLQLTQNVTPTSSADAQGNTGDIAKDNNYIYVKTATGWKRAALSTF